MYFDEDLVLELRLNLLDKYVDYFVIVESKYNHKGEPKKLNFNIWIDTKQRLIVKVQYERLGIWEYRIKKFE